MSFLQQAIEARKFFQQPFFDKNKYLSSSDTKCLNMQVGLIGEETDEMLEALEDYLLMWDDLATNLASLTEEDKIQLDQAREDLLKEMGDLVFVVYQLAAAFGLDLDSAMQRIFESNMTKKDDSGNPIFSASGKVLKGDNYVPPSMCGLV